MSSEPGYFYTVELPEKYGRMLEQLAAESDGMMDPESLAANLLCIALDAEDGPELARLVAKKTTTAGPGGKRPL